MSENELGTVIIVATVIYFSFLAWLSEKPFNLQDELNKDD